MIKWIGQHIVSLIARFRSDVYLEEVSTGTIASGGNLGLDSNNKIVKNTVSGGTTDLTSDVTGALPVGNGGTGTTSYIDNQIVAYNAGTGKLEGHNVFFEQPATNAYKLKIGDSSTTSAILGSENGAPLSVSVDLASGANAAGGDLTLTAGLSTGTAAGGDIVFRSSPTGSSGSIPNTNTEIAKFDNSGNLQLDGGITTGSTSFVNSSGVVQVASQGTIDHDSLANFVAAEHYRWDNDISGTATINAANIPTLNQNTTGTAAGLSATLAVGSGGTGAASLTSNSILTGNGTSAIQAESTLSYSSEILDIGADDNSAAQIRRLRHTDEAGGDLYIRGGDATGTNKDGGDLQIFGGRATGNGAGGAVIIQAGETNASSGTPLRGTNVIASFRADGDTLLQGNLIFEGPVIDGNDTTFSITEQTANRTITVPDASGTMALTGVNYNYQYITFVGNSTANTSSNGYWEYPTANGISNHLWTQPVLTKVDGTDNRDTTTVGNEVGIDRLNQGSAGIRIPYAGTIVGFTGSGRNASGDRVYYAGLFVGTPDWGTNNKINAELVAVAAADNNSGSYHSRPAKLEDLSRSYSIAAGDVIYPALKGSGTNADILQASFTVVIKTAIV